MTTEAKRLYDRDRKRVQRAKLSELLHVWQWQTVHPCVYCGLAMSLSHADGRKVKYCYCRGPRDIYTLEFS